MTKMLLSHTQITTLHKLKAHINISGNEHAYALAKQGCEVEHIIATTPLEHACLPPYYFRKDWWHFVEETPDKGPIRHLATHIVKHDKGHQLAIIETQTQQLHNWLENDNINKVF